MRLSECECDSSRNYVELFYAASSYTHARTTLMDVWSSTEQVTIL